MHKLAAASSDSGTAPAQASWPDSVESMAKACPAVAKAAWYSAWASVDTAWASAETFALARASPSLVLGLGPSASLELAQLAAARAWAFCCLWHSELVDGETGSSHDCLGSDSNAAASAVVHHPMELDRLVLVLVMSLWHHEHRQCLSHSAMVDCRFDNTGPYAFATVCSFGISTVPWIRSPLSFGEGEENQGLENDALVGLG